MIEAQSRRNEGHFTGFANNAKCRASPRLANALVAKPPGIRAKEYRRGATPDRMDNKITHLLRAAPRGVRVCLFFFSVDAPFLLLGLF